MADAFVIYGPDNCPWHYRDPGERVELYYGDRYLGPTTAEILCDSWHLNAAIGAELNAAWETAQRVSNPARLPPVYRVCAPDSESP